MRHVGVLVACGVPLVFTPHDLSAQTDGDKSYVGCLAFGVVR